MKKDIRDMSKFARLTMKRKVHFRSSIWFCLLITSTKKKWHVKSNITPNLLQSNLKREIYKHIKSLEPKNKAFEKNIEPQSQEKNIKF